MYLDKWKGDVRHLKKKKTTTCLEISSVAYSFYVYKLIDEILSFYVLIYVSTKRSNFILKYKNKSHVNVAICVMGEKNKQSTRASSPIPKPTEISQRHNQTKECVNEYFSN